MLILKW